MAKNNKKVVVDEVEEKLIEHRLLKLSTFVRCYNSILSVNLVGFLTENVWNFVPTPLDSELLRLSHNALCALPTCDDLFSSNDVQLSPEEGKSIPLGPVSEFAAVHQLITDIRRHRLENLQVLTPLQDILTEFGIQTLQNDHDQCSSQPVSERIPEGPPVRPKRNSFMNEKKSHEVETMARVVAAIAKKTDIDQVVDIGSGKGYLGQCLALQYSLNVFGIDSSPSNSCSAQIRDQKLRKQWPSKNLKSSDALLESTSLSCNMDELYSLNTTLGGSEEMHDTNLTMNHHTERSKLGDISVSSNLDVKFVKKAKRMISDDEDDLKGPPWSSTQSLQKPYSIFTDQEKSSIISKKHCKYGCDCTTIDQDNATGVCTCRFCGSSSKLVESAEPAGVASKMEGMSLYSPVTAFIDAHTDILGLLNASCTCNSRQKCVILSGLHTCGDLSSSMLRLFLANQSTFIMCNVPCCYHLLTEEFIEQPSTEVHCGSSGAMHYGFPMSAYLRSMKCKIGDVARMVACMAAERLAHEKKPSIYKLFYRAVLQVILKENYAIPTREQRTGKLASKCKTFVEYTRKALKKMGFKEDKLSNQVIEQYYNTYEPEIKKLEAFNLLRAALAPSLEALILLDKMCFLKEQNSVQQVYLVRLFDPIKSPRCYAIIAAK